MIAGQVMPSDFFEVLKWAWSLGPELIGLSDNAYYAEKRSAKELIIAPHRLALPSACQLQGKEAVLTTES